MPASITLHTNRTLYDKWHTRYTDTSTRIKELKAKRESTFIDSDELSADEAEIQELCIQANLIHQFLADVGIMARIEDRTDGGAY
ncbi:hypothetical protein [Metabacillus sp. SLBN-84]